MNLEEQLRAAFTLEAEMSIAPLPDTDHLISGGQTRRRRRNAGRIGLVAAAVVLIGGGAYAVTQINSGKAQTGPDIVGKPSQTSQTATEPTGQREVVGAAAKTGEPITIVVPKSATLFGGATGVAAENHAHAGLHVFQARSIAGGTSGCYGDRWGRQSRTAADSARAQGRQLQRLPGSTLLQPLTPTTAFGYDAFHLRLRVNTGCPGGPGYMVAESDSDFGVNYSRTPKDVVIDFLVVDVHGTPIVVALWNEADASSDLVQRATRVRNAIHFVTST